MNERLAFLAAACDNEFDDAEMQIINDLLVMIMPSCENANFLSGNKYKYELELYDYMKLKYDEVNMQSERKKITSRFGYLKKILETEVRGKGEAK